MDAIELTHNGVAYRIEPVEGGGYFAAVPELPGCFSEGETLDEAFRNIREALALYVEGSLEAGLAIPDKFVRLFAQAS